MVRSTECPDRCRPANHRPGGVLLRCHLGPVAQSRSEPGICGEGSSRPSFVSCISATSIVLRSKTSASLWNFVAKESKFHCRKRTWWKVRRGVTQDCSWGDLVLQQTGAWKCRNGNAMRSARTVVQENNAVRAGISYERRTCSHGRQVFWGLASVLEHAGHFRLLYKRGAGFV